MYTAIQNYICDAQVYDKGSKDIDVWQRNLVQCSKYSQLNCAYFGHLVYHRNRSCQKNHSSYKPASHNQ